MVGKKLKVNNFYTSPNFQRLIDAHASDKRKIYGANVLYGD